MFAFEASKKLQQIYQAKRNLFCDENMSDIILNTEAPFPQLQKFFSDANNLQTEAWSLPLLTRWIQLVRECPTELCAFWEEAQYVKRVLLHKDLAQLFINSMEMIGETNLEDLLGKSAEDLSNLLKKDQTYSYSGKFYQEPDFVNALNWLKLCSKLIELAPAQVEGKRPLNDSLGSSGTPKKTKKTPSKKSVTSTSTTAARSIKVTAPVLSSEDSSSNDFDLDSLLQSVKPNEPTGVPGLNIFLQKGGNSFTFKSEEFPSAEMYINISICEQPLAIKKTKPMEHWKSMEFRAKALGKSNTMINIFLLITVFPYIVGRNTVGSQARFQKVKECVETLKKLLLAETMDFPGLEKKVTDMSVKK